MEQQKGQGRDRLLLTTAEVRGKNRSQKFANGSAQFPSCLHETAAPRWHSFQNESTQETSALTLQEEA